MQLNKLICVFQISWLWAEFFVGRWEWIDMDHWDNPDKPLDIDYWGYKNKYEYG